MKKASTTRFRYFPVSKRDRSWGLFISTIGVSQIEPNTPYPPVNHPRGYMFDWEHGRVLREFQVVYISQGAGSLETSKGHWKIQAGDAFILQPGVWHHYRPEMRSGWQEHWVGFDGPIARQIVKQKLFYSNSPRFRLRDERPLASEFHVLHQLAAASPFALQQILAGHTMTILALLVSATRPEVKRDDKDAQVIQAAMTLLNDKNADDLDLEDMAKSLNVSYSWFRRTFKQRVGVSPHHFRLHVKLTEARELLRTTTLSVKEVCDRSGFESEPYFCRLFKEQVGCTPSEFRSSGPSPIREKAGNSSRKGN
jgi:AraC-like DNA-binding protein